MKLVSDSLPPHGLGLTRLFCPWDSPSKNTGVGCHFLHQGIFPTQESNLGLLHCRHIVYRLSYEGSPLNYWTAGEVPARSFLSQLLALIPITSAPYLERWHAISLLFLQHEQCICVYTASVSLS